MTTDPSRQPPSPEPTDDAVPHAASPDATIRRGPLLRVAVVSALFAGLLGGGALSAPAPDAGSDFSQVATIITLATGAVSLLVLVVAALAARSGAPQALPWRLVSVALAVLAVGVLTGIGVGTARTVDQGTGDPVWVAISTGLLVALIVLVHARWLRRRLPLR
jgi:hypothetical protein